MCGILGLYSTSPSHSLSHFISRLKLLQHRGKDGWGVGYIGPNNQPKIIKSLGLIKQYTFNELQSLPFHAALDIFATLPPNYPMNYNHWLGRLERKTLCLPITVIFPS